MRGRWGKSPCGFKSRPRHQPHPILKVENLSISIGEKKIVDSVNFSLSESEVLGIVGESGSGKTMTAMSIVRLLPQSAKVAGQIIFDGVNLLSLSEKQLQRIRGKDIFVIMQNPHSVFNPVFKVGYQVVEPLIIHRKESFSSSISKAERVFAEVGISDPKLRLNSYPHELSGGMKQRAVISISILSKVKLIIADEPTTALDPTVEAQIIKLLRTIVEKNRSAMIFISHDISLVAWISDMVAVMYGGWIVEYGTVSDVLRTPSHPYTRALIDATPQRKGKGIPGSPQDINWQGCRFAKRCPLAQNKCFSEVPPDNLYNSKIVKCFFPL